MRRQDKDWGQGIVVGAHVTSLGHHGVGQPPITGTVVAIYGDLVTVLTLQGRRRRAICNLRRI